MLLTSVWWLDGLPACVDLLSPVPSIKLKHKAERTAVLDAGDLKVLTAPKRHAPSWRRIAKLRILVRNDGAKITSGAWARA